MIIFISNKTTKFRQITMRVLKDLGLFIKEKWFFFLPHGVEALPRNATDATKKQCDYSTCVLQCDLRN